MSATGNTRWAAKRLSEAFNEELIAINSLEDDEVVLSYLKMKLWEFVSLCMPGDHLLWFAGCWKE